MKISTKTKDAMHTSTTSAEISSPTSYLITGTTTNGPTTAPATDIFARPLATSTAAAPIPSTSSSLPGLSGVSTEWKVLGIAVIAISGLAVMVITVVFYDAWSGFLLDILCCGQRKKGADGAEEFVPDWEKRSWEVQLKAQGEDRYPSVEDLAQPRAVVRRPGIVPLDPRPASDVLRCANPFESHLDYQQAPYEHDTGDIIPDPYPQAHVAPSDGRHERTYTVTPNPYDGIA
ncbi:hypothetical protein OE88DRAFT_40362 [Heliocybe sulcata]|uniref:Uncharacterized protein n=1 Tax=Heliocybe sulcata TaxID=5364 RepID=A0A5C3NIH9_9AGAM|nr:hypothetical protein OE88DRAFT_40362 [Heliocybe sulcata]